jgi:outer membrane protein TolC
MCCAIGVWAAGAVSATAQPPLTLGEAVRTAAESSNEVIGARSGTREAEARVPQARAAYLPRVDVTQSWQRGNQPVFVFGSLLGQRQFTDRDFALTQLNTPAPITNGRTAFSLEQVIFDGGATHAASRAASLSADIARHRERQVRHDVALAATRAYGSALRADASHAAAASAVAAAEEDVRVAEARRDAGTGTEADVLSMRVHLANVRARAITAGSDARIARAELNRLMGVPLQRHFSVIEPVIDPDETLEAAALLARAIAQHPEIGQARLRVDLARASRSGARSAWLPQVAGQAAYEWNDGSRGSPASAWVAGATIRMNLFAGGARLARGREAAHAVERAEAERDRLEAAVQLDVLTALEQLNAAKARRAVDANVVAHANESERIIRDRFSAGMAAAADVIRAATAKLDAEAQRVTAVVDVIVAQAALRRAIGAEEAIP